MKNINNIYNYFEEYTKEQIDKGLTKLPIEDLKIIYARYGMDLENPTVNKLTKEQRNIFYEDVIPRLKTLLSETKKIKDKDRLISNLIYKTKEKYKDYSDYLDDLFYDELKKNILDLYDYSSSINPEIYLRVIIDNFVLQKFSGHIKNGEIDLEIMLIDKYLNYVKAMMRKLDFSENYISDNSENMLIDILENYNGDLNFYIYMGKCIKNKVPLKQKKLNKQRLL